MSGMTAAPLDFTFPLVTPPIARPGADPLRLSIRPLHQIPRDEMLAELRHESNRRHAIYPKWAEAGRLTRAEAIRHMRLIDQVLDDMTEAEPNQPWDARHRFDEEKAARRAASGILWPDKVRELRRELAIRRNGWPKRIAAGRLDLAEARASMERLEAVHWRYWIACDHYEPEPTLDGIRAHVQAIDAFHAAALHARDHRITAHLSPAETAWLREHHPAPKEAA